MVESMNCSLGIDTGGTYTDSVIMDMRSCELLSRSKSLTTRDDLEIGIRSSLEGLDKNLLSKISYVSLSSTLATNAMVEGKSCRVGLISIGKKAGFTAPVSHYAYVDGKFDMMGNELVELDVESAHAELIGMKGRVDALAISGYLSVRNPSHENRIREMAMEILDVPIVCTHELSYQLGFNERTNTAIINAGLIPIIVELIDSVKRTLDSFGIEAPLMIVKGDGSVMDSKMAVKKPVETILSGPASSITGALALTGVKDAIVIDIGGTTSDIGILEDGRPRTNENGADIEGHRTRVRAADIKTYGIGGDSRIIVNGDDIRILPTRSIPLCMASIRWPSIKSKLANILEKEISNIHDYSDDCNIVQEFEFFTPASNKDLERLSKKDVEFVNAIGKEPMTVDEVSSLLDVAKHSFSIGEMIARGYITRIGLTPTDIASLDTDIYDCDRETSAMAVEISSKKSRLFVFDFTDRVHRMIRDKIVSCVLNDILDNRDDSERECITRELLSNKSSIFSIHAGLNVPLIGIGAPAATWLRDVAEFFGCELILPENYDVTNAIGTVAGSVSETAVVTVKASPQDLNDDPECTVFSINGKRSFPNIDSSIEFAVCEGETIARESARRSNATDVLIDVKVERITKDLVGDGIKRFREAIVRVTATGKPTLLRE